jgi:hypothetical protein
VKVALLGACGLALFAAVGCGSSSSSSSDAGDEGPAPTTSVKTPSNTADPTHAEMSTSWMLLFGEGGTKSARPQELYAVFARKQTDDEAKIAPELVAESSCSLGPPGGGTHTDHGKPIVEKARILLDEVGSGGDRLVAVPTTADRVSLAVFPDGGGTCTRPGENGLIVGAEGSDEATTVYGMVDDRVRSVDVVADGRTHRAKLGENGFSVALPGHAGVNQLVLNKADDSKTVVPLG